MIITLMCHGNVTDNSNLIPHQYQALSKKGIEQAFHIREKLREPKFDVVFHPNSRATRETGQLIAGLEEDDPKLVVVPDLFCRRDNHTWRNLIDALDNLGRAALRHYHYYANLRDALEAWSIVALNEIKVEVVRQKAKRILIVGHHTLVQELGIRITGQFGPFCTRILNEGEGYQIVLTTDWKIDEYVLYVD